MRFRTRQEHIDPQILKVEKCYAAGHTFAASSKDVMVLFTNGAWVCSSGHVGDYDDVPNLRRPELDPLHQGGALGWVISVLSALSSRTMARPSLGERVYLYHRAHMVCSR